MNTIAPTVTASDIHEYRRQLERIMPFAKRIHIDVMDGIFAPTKSPPLSSLWLPDGIPCDLHVMFLHPEKQLKNIIHLKPAMVIIHAEASCDDVNAFREELAAHGIKTGIALLQGTFPAEYKETIVSCDHCLIFSGKLGYHGGVADIELLKKANQIKAINPLIELGWDGGINKDTVKQLAVTVDVLNVGGAIQKADDPLLAYTSLVKALHEA